MITREEIAKVLRNIALLMEIKGENPFKIRAYKNGAEVVELFQGDIVKEAADENLKGTKGIGDALAQKLHELATTGKLEFYEKLCGEFPDGILELFEIQGMGGKKIKALYDELNVGTVADLKRVCESGEAAKLSGFGAKSAEKILAAIAFRESNADRFRLGQVAENVETVLEFLRGLPEVNQVEVAGSYRRAKETVHDLDFIVSTKEPEAVMAAFVKIDGVKGVIAQGKTKASVYLKNGVQCDLRAVTAEEYPFALNYFTGSKEHNVAMRGRALKRGFTLNEYRLGPVEEGGEEAPEIRTEAELYGALGLEYVEPEMRENTGEIEASENRELPKLIEISNLRGTFHNHTTASDGRNTLEEMAEAAQELGLEYLGIADHSKSSFQANGLDEDRLRAQIAEIRELNKGFDGFRLFAGTECDILKDGTLDFDDELLGECDYVVASVHGSFQLPEKEMTARIIKAISNPNVTMLGHMTGRLLLQRDPYSVNVPEVIDAAAETGTIIELNASPWRLDMDWRWWRMAAEKGVKCAINPDAHSTGGLQDLHFGVRLARKGWLRKEDVVNCFSLGEVEEVLKGKN